MYRYGWMGKQWKCKDKYGYIKVLYNTCIKKSKKNVQMQTCMTFRNNASSKRQQHYQKKVQTVLVNNSTNINKTTTGQQFH